MYWWVSEMDTIVGGFVTISLKMLVDLSNLLYYKGSLCTILLEKYQDTSRSHHHI